MAGAEGAAPQRRPRRQPDVWPPACRGTPSLGRAQGGQFENQGPETQGPKGDRSTCMFRGRVAFVDAGCAGWCQLSLLVCGVAGVLPSLAQATVSLCNVAIPMSDGTVLRANVYLPSRLGHATRPC